MLGSGEKLFIHVMPGNEPDKLVAQLDVPFTGDDLTGKVRTYGVPLPDSIAPGAYKVYVGLYNSNLSNLPREMTTTGADKVELSQFSMPSSN